jgi:hypothetical protein
VNWNFRLCLSLFLLLTVIDTVGGSTQQRTLDVLKRGGILVSSVSPVPKQAQQRVFCLSVGDFA